MTKSFKRSGLQSSDDSDTMRSNQSSHSVYKYSNYMQSKDSAWIERNIKDNNEENEPIEEDIRD